MVVTRMMNENSDPLRAASDPFPARKIQEGHGHQAELDKYQWDEKRNVVADGAGAHNDRSSFLLSPQYGQAIQSGANNFPQLPQASGEAVPHRGGAPAPNHGRRVTSR
mgnify:CR=1 FL=1